MSNARSTAQQEKPTLAAIVERIDEISTLPRSALVVMEIANDPNSDAADLKEAIEKTLL